MAQGFAETHKRLSGLESEQHRLEQDMSEVKGRLDFLAGEVGDLKGDMAEIKTLLRNGRKPR